MNLKEQLAAKKKEFAALKSRIEADDADAIKQADELKKEIDNLNAQIELAETKARLLEIMGKEAEQGDGIVVVEAKSLGENFVKRLKESGKTYMSGEKFSVSAPSFKSSSDVQKTPTTSGVSAYATTYDRNVVTGARTPLVVRDLFASEEISGSTLVYLVEGAIEGAPAATNEGAKKPQVHFADPTPKTVSLAKIACHIKESDEYINDYKFLASAINGRLLYHLALVEQNKLVTDLLATSGIQSDTTTWTASSTATAIADLVLEAASDVQTNSGFAADAVMINPADWYALRIAKDGEARYYGGGFFGAQSVDNLWGIPACVTTAVSAGTIVVGAYKACGSVVQNGGVRVEAVNTDQDDFVKNLMTIRAEERLALAVRRPAGFKKLVKVVSQ